MGTFLPIKRPKAESCEHRLVWLQNFTMAKMHSTTLSEQGEMASPLLRQVTSLTPFDILPTTGHGRIRSLYMMGDVQATTGLLRKPAWPSQFRVVSLIRSYLQSGRALPDLSLPVCHQCRDDALNNRYSWEEKSLFARQSLTKIRNARRRGKDIVVEDLTDYKFNKSHRG